MNGLGLSGPPTTYSAEYLQANIEGGEGFNWFYNDSKRRHGSRPLGDRPALHACRKETVWRRRATPFRPTSNCWRARPLRWWWSNKHQAVYDAGDGLGWAPHGPTTQWTPQAKPIIFAEYGFACVDRCTNQPNVFYDVTSSDSATPFWSLWQGPYGDAWLPKRDDLLADMALQAVHDYWSGAKNETSAAGVPMIFTPFLLRLELGRASLSGVSARRGRVERRRQLGDRQLDRRQGARARPARGRLAAWARRLCRFFRRWSARAGASPMRPVFRLRSHAHVSGREVRVSTMSAALYDIDLELRPAAERCDLCRSPTGHRFYRRPCRAGAALPVCAPSRPERLPERATRPRRRRNDILHDFAVKSAASPNVCKRSSARRRSI